MGSSVSLVSRSYQDINIAAIHGRGGFRGAAPTLFGKKMVIYIGNH